MLLWRVVHSQMPWQRDKFDIKTGAVVYVFLD